MTRKIKVVDSYTGSGKTTWAIQKMNSDVTRNRFLYITPYLDETERIERECPRLNFHRPNAKKGRGRKMVHLLQLIQEGRNISSTHSLFSNITDEVVEALRASNYILILDEAFQVLEKFDMWRDDFTMAGEDYKAELTRQNIQTLTNKGFVEVSDNYQVKWVDEDNPLHKYAPLKRLADRGLLYAIRGSLLLWSFPTEVFAEGIFEDVYVLTYQFEYQLQAHYYKYFGIQYDEFHIERIDSKYTLVPSLDNNYDLEFRERIKERIVLVDSEKMNKIGDPYSDSSSKRRESTLSKSWYNKFAETMMPFLVKNMLNFFINVSDSRAKDRMWTCFAQNKEEFRSRAVNPKHWVALNARATNQYGDKTAVAYMINRYLNPFYDAFFGTRGIPLNQDGYALSEMIQWLFRSALRNGQTVHVYIPSWRMRSLLEAYLNNEPLESIYKD